MKNQLRIMQAGASVRKQDRNVTKSADAETVVMARKIRRANPGKATRRLSQENWSQQSRSHHKTFSKAKAKSLNIRNFHYLRK